MLFAKLQQSGKRTITASVIDEEEFIIEVSVGRCSLTS